MVFAIKLRVRSKRVTASFKGMITHVPKEMIRLNRHNCTIIKRVIQNLIKREAKYSGTNPNSRKFGPLAEKIDIRKADNGYNMVATAPYARYVEEGTEPHFIPFGLGRIEGVEHPGARAKRYFQRGTRMALKAIQRNTAAGFIAAMGKQIK